MFKIILVFLIGISINHGSETVFKIGAIFYHDAFEMMAAFNLSAKLFNFETIVKNVARGEILNAGQAVCELAEQDIIGLIDGTGGRSSEHIQAVCDMLEIPHVIVQHNDFYSANWSLLNLYPSTSTYNMVLENLITHKEWTNFTILYAKGHSIARVRSLLKMGNVTDKSTVTVRELSGDDYRDVLIGAKHSGFVNFVVDCPSENLELFLNHAQQVGLMADEHSYIFLSPDLFSFDLSTYRYGGVNITGFRLLDLMRNEKMWNFTYYFNQELGGEFSPEQVKTEVVLIHDALKVFSMAMKKINVTFEVDANRKVSCNNYEPWAYGASVLNFMRTNRIEGLTRALIFDGLGQRNNVHLEILELTPAGNQSIGYWKDNQLKISRPILPTADITGETIMKNKTFKVLISTTAPYGYIKESADNLQGNTQYEGFTVDLFEKISQILGFNYELEVENVNGALKDNKWNGMVLKIREEKADFGLSDFTITADRQKVIDFSVPFMTLGIGILYKEPSKQPPEMFSFMAVFSKEVWISMMLVQIGLGVIMIFVGRISHKEWQNPVPCIEQPEEFRNQFSFANSIWLIIGSVMQQGSEIAPIAIAPRMITSVWWFFTMVMVASYTGTLVAFLTVEKNVLPFENVDQLYNHKFISYGAIRSGSTNNFFRDSKKSTHQKMYKKMKERGWLVSENDEGVAIAENTTYAFFMESTSIEYYKERHCDLLQIGDLLDSKSYGIGMKKESPYRYYIDQALLKLKEQGEIQKLKDIWWKEKRGGGKCGTKRNEEEKQLEMKNLIGAFVVLGVGCLIGLGISTMDMLWGVYKRTLKYDTSFQFELVEELKFVIKFTGDVKPVRRMKTDEGSSEALAAIPEEDEKSEVTSHKSIKSSATSKSHHSHGSRHTRKSLTMIFSRMRDSF